MKKIINSTGEQFKDILTDELVLDATPTEGSFNAVTSDGVAKAIAGGGGGGGTTYTAGDGISISEDHEVSVKVDGTTIGVNESGELEALGGGGGTEYSAGAGITIDGNGAISVVPDNTTVKVERPQAVYATNGFYGMSFSDTVLGNATSSSTCTFSYGLNANGAAFKIGCDSDQIGCQIRVEIGNDSSFTKSVLSTVSMAKSNQTGVLVTLTDTATILEGYGLSFYRGMGSHTPTFSNSFDWSEYTFEEIFGNSSIYVRLRAWDSTNGAVVGQVLTNPISTGYVSANMGINSDAIPQQVMVKFGNASNSGLTTNSYGLAVANPVPDSSGASQGDVLKIGSNGPEWGSAGGGGSDMEIMKSATYATPDGKQLRFNVSGDIEMSGYGNIATISWQNGGSIAVVYSPWDLTATSTTNILTLNTGSYVSEAYCLAWYPNSSGNVYARYKSFVRRSISNYYIYDGYERRNVGYGYSFDIEVPPGPNPVFDTSKFDLVGDWSTVVGPISTWGLAFVDESGIRTAAGLQYNRTTTTWSIAGARPKVRLKPDGGISNDFYNGLYVTVPVPAFDASTDAGKILQVQSDGTLAWVAPSSAYPGPGG